MKTMHRKLILLVVLVLFTLACGFPGLVGNQGLPDGLMENYVPEMDASQLLGYVYSQEQLTFLQTYGNPTRFTIIFADDLRQETWHYDTTGYTVVFRNGDKISEGNVVAEYRENMFATTYTPSLFYRGMGIDEIVLATGKQKFVLTSMDDLVEGGRLMHLEGLSVGLKDGQITYVETIPAVTEMPLGPQDFGN